MGDKSCTSQLLLKVICRLKVNFKKKFREKNFKHSLLVYNAFTFGCNRLAHDLAPSINNNTQLPIVSILRMIETVL